MQDHSDATVAIELTKAQIDRVVHTVGEGGAMSVLFTALRDPAWRPSIVSTYPQEMSNRRLSRSLLAGLYVLSCFPLEDAVGVAELANMVGMSVSTTHRYVSTLTAMGLLEQDTATRKYRLARTQ
jgi:hypothetical protein